jgi:adenosylcobyric acid synthase
MTPEKTTRQVTFQFGGQTCQGYEIHQGVSDTDEAVMMGDRCMGTYIHGFLDNAPVIDYLLREKGKVNSEKWPSALRHQTSALRHQTSTLSYADFKEEQYDKLAGHIRKYVDVPRLYQIMQDYD